MTSDIDLKNVDVDKMSYEQLIALQDKIGYVNRGYSQAEIDIIPARLWCPGFTNEDDCSICMEDFDAGI